MKNQCIVVGGVPIKNPERILKKIHPDAFIIYCDGGLKNREILDIEPDLVVADFDSFPKGDYAPETLELPHIKDDSDTAVAVKEALKRGYRDFILAGCVGLRLDHTLGNIAILLSLFDMGINALMIDDFSEMEIVGKNEKTISPEFPYFSLMNIDGRAGGVSIKNALYSHEWVDMENGFTLGLSNEPLPGQTARVFVREGRLLLLRIFEKD